MAFQIYFYLLCVLMEKVIIELLMGPILNIIIS